MCFLCVAILQCAVIYPFKNSSQLENKNMVLKHNVSLCKKNNLKCSENSSQLENKNNVLNHNVQVIVL